MTAHQLRAVCFLVAAVVGVGLIAVADRLFDDWMVTVGVALYFAVIALAIPWGTE